VYHKKKTDSVKNLYDPTETSASLLQENATIGRQRSVRIVSLPPNHLSSEYVVQAEKILEDSTPVKITFSFSNSNSHPAGEMAVTIHQFSLA
jgi:hypothetical protein